MSIAAATGLGLLVFLAAAFLWLKMRLDSERTRIEPIVASP